MNKGYAKPLLALWWRLLTHLQAFSDCGCQQMCLIEMEVNLILLTAFWCAFHRLKNCQQWLCCTPSFTDAANSRPLCASFTDDFYCETHCNLSLPKVNQIENVLKVILSIRSDTFPLSHQSFFLSIGAPAICCLSISQSLGSGDETSRKRT